MANHIESLADTATTVQSVRSLPLYHHKPPQWRPILYTLLVTGFFCFCGAWGIELLAADLSTVSTGRQASMPQSASTFDCSQVTAVSVNECQALVALYDATDGPNWLQQQNWLMMGPMAPCGWYGVRCANGHVTGLLLAANQLSGTLPITIGHLSELTTLRLENNVLSGPILNKVCNITQKLTDFSVAYNMLVPRSKQANECLSKVEPNWLATQTLAPRDLTISAFDTDALRLTWSPIPYGADGGYYEISYSTAITGPYTIHGTTTDKLADTYLVDGLQPGQRYFFQVRTHTPPHGAQTNALYSTAAKVIGMTKATTGNVLVAAYFPADNDLSSQIRYVANRLRRGTQFNPNVTVLLLADGLGDNNTELLLMRDGVVTPTNVVETVWGKKELDTADPAVLSWFLTYARQNYPATKEIVSLIGHGLALAPELDFGDVDQAAGVDAAAGPQRGTFPALPREWEDMPSDVTDNSYMSTTDVGEALLAATNDGKDPYDIVYFDQCFQGSLDTLYEVHKTAKIFIASPNYAWLVAAYDKYIMGFSPNATIQELAFTILTQYEGSLNNRHPNAILGIRGVDIPPIAEAMSTLGDALTSVVNAGQTGRIATAVQQANYVDTTQCGKQNLVLGPPDELVGIEGLAQELQTEFLKGDGHGVLPAIEQVRQAIQKVIRRGRSGNPYIAPDEFWDYRDSLTVLAPLPRNTPAGVAWRASIYRPDAPFSATWSLDPTEPLTVVKSLAYTKEGRWDDFLSVWFQNLSPRVGQWCHYIPPEQVLLDDTESFSLTVTVEDVNNLALKWEAADDASADEYLVYLDGPYEISWELAESVGITETSARFPALAAGTYQAQILARNAENEYVAASNVATIEVPDPPTPTDVRVYLPLVLR